VTGDIHHVVDATEQPQVALAIEAGSVARKIAAGEARPVGLLIAIWIPPNTAQHRGPGLGDREVAAAFSHQRASIIDQLGAISCKPASDPAFETAAELIFRGKVIGKIGVIKKKIRTGRVGKDKWRMLEPIAVAEFDYEGLLSTFGKVVKPKTISEYPASRRDTALVLDAAVSYDDVIRVIKKAAPNELVALDLFDVYEGDKLPDGKKSLAFRLTYQSPDRTLKDEDCTAFQNAIKAALRKQLGAEVPEDA